MNKLYALSICAKSTNGSYFHNAFFIEANSIIKATESARKFIPVYKVSTEDNQKEVIEVVTIAIKEKDSQESYFELYIQENKNESR